MPKTHYKEEMKLWKQILALNKSAMTKLKYQQYRKWLEILSQAKELIIELNNYKQFTKTNEFSSVASITFNNFGCYYQK